MFRPSACIFIISLLLLGCTPNDKLETNNLEVEQEEIATTYKPVKKEVALNALPFDVSFPTYIPFQYEETKVGITQWDDEKKELSLNLMYPTTEGDSKWEEGAFVQNPIPRVGYTVVNFDQYFTRKKNSGDYEGVELDEGTLALYKNHLPTKHTAELYWLHKGKEYRVFLKHVKEMDEQELKEEILKVANSIELN